MKKYLFILLVLFGVYSCNKNRNCQPPSVMKNPSWMTVMKAIVNPNQSYLDVKDELFMLIDTMQAHVEFNPNFETRIEARIAADMLIEMLLKPDMNTPEEIKFTIDSVLMPMTDVRSTWYYEVYDNGKHSMSMHMNRHNRQTNNLESTQIQLLANEEEELLVIIMPNETYQFTSLTFSTDSIFTLDSIGFYREDAQEIGRLEDYDVEYVIFGPECIEQMLSHKTLLIGFIGEDESKTLKERYQSYMLPLYKFQGQYEQYIYPLKENNNP